MPTVDQRGNEHGIMLAKRRQRNADFHNLESLENTPMKSPLLVFVENDHEMRSTQVTKSKSSHLNQRRKFQINQSPTNHRSGLFKSPSQERLAGGQS